ncbi:MAG TPA: DUF423 domain-containing protein [Polyangia bacterium]|jgi:uncharacterized membrane protein YgdD (TMEM256/DUF423 family)|nr:DUF423 domain-containing protein [Polyangia bacterium]
MKRGALAVAGLLGFTAVAFGAFGAHGLRGRLSPAMLEIYRTGALYHLVHAVAALAVALAGERLRRGPMILTLFTLGIIVFAGSLYALAITGITALGAVTPLGGLLLLAAWALVALEAVSASKNAS